MIHRLRRLLASILIVALLLVNVPAPTAAEQVPTVPTVQAVDPLQVASVRSSTPVSGNGPAKAIVLPASSFIAPHVATLPFKPFDVVDPQTGKKVSRSATIYLPHQRRHVNAGEYYDAVNKTEQSLNKLGYTLRSHNAGPTLCQSIAAAPSSKDPPDPIAPGRISPAFASAYTCKTAALSGRLKGSEQAELLTTIRYQPGSSHLSSPVLQLPDIISQLSKLDAMVNPALVGEEDRFQATLAPAAQHMPAGISSPTPPPGSTAATMMCKNCARGAAALPTPHHKCLSSKWFPSSEYSHYWYWASLERNGIKDKGIRLPPLCHMPREADLQGRAAALASPWSTSFGGQSTAEFSLGSNLQVAGDASPHGTGTQLEAYAGAQAYLLGNGPNNIASVRASATGRKGSVDVEVMSQTPWHRHGSGRFHDNKTFNVTFFSFSVCIPILWFCVNLGASAWGSFGIQSAMNLSPRSSGFLVGPFVSISGKFTAGIGVSIVILSVSIGFYGQLLIAKFSLGFSAHGAFKTVAAYSGKIHKRSNIVACKLLFQDRMSLDDKFTTLSGQMGVYAQLCLDLFFWSNCWTAQAPLFNWSGYSTSGNIFAIPQNPTWAQVGPSYTDMPAYGYPLFSNSVYSPDDRSGEPAVCHQLGVK